MDYEIDIIQDSVAKSNKSFVLSTILWDSFDGEIRTLLHSNENWHEVKFLDQNGAASTNFNSVPNDAGGIYVFMTKPGILPDFHNYLMYIGMSSKTSSRNLRKRLLEYYAEQKDLNKRPKVLRMLNWWGEYLYIRYLPLYGFNNSEIEKIEAELINKILPPFNDKIPDKKLRAIIKAFG